MSFIAAPSKRIAVWGMFASLSLAALGACTANRAGRAGDAAARDGQSEGEARRPTDGNPDSPRDGNAEDEPGGGNGGRRGGSDAAVDSGGAAGTGGAGAGGSAGTGGRGTGGSPTGSGGTPAAGYDGEILVDHPVAFWALGSRVAIEPDLTGNGRSGSYRGGVPALAMLPNGDPAAAFDGAAQFLTVPSHPSLSIATTGSLTWEAWIRPDVLQFPRDSNGYVDWMGKCANYAPSCEWEARMYSTTNSEGRCNRLSAYVFNPTAGLGSAADWQPTCGLFAAGRWYHVVGEYTTATQPSNCPDSAAYPGSINIWVNGIPWNQARHSPTGCMSQYRVVPRGGDSPLNIGTMAGDAWFPGAIAKVAIYDYPLPQSRIVSHYRTMTGLDPMGSCAADCRF